MQVTEDTNIIIQLQDSIRMQSLDDTTALYTSLCNQALELSNEQLFSDLTVIYISYLVDHDYTKEVIRFSVRYMTIAEMKGWHNDDLTYCSVASTLYLMLQDYDMAIYYMHKEVDIASKLDRVLVQAHCFGNIGWLNLQNKQYNQALNVLTDALLIYNKHNTGPTAEEIRTLTNLSTTYLELNQLNKAEKYLKIILNWKDIDKYKSLKIELYANFAKYHLKTNNLQEAILYYTEAIYLAEEENSSKQLLQLYHDIFQPLYQDNQFLDMIHMNKKFVEATNDILTQNDQSNYRLFKNELKFAHSRYFSSKKPQSPRIKSKADTLKDLDTYLRDDTFETASTFYDHEIITCLIEDDDDFFIDLNIIFISYLVDYNYTSEVIRYCVRIMALFEYKGWQRLGRQSQDLKKWGYKND